MNADRFISRTCEQTMASELFESQRRRILIVGAGCCGLTAVKCCLDEKLIPVCLEKSDDIGGLWNFSAHSRPGSASIYNSLVINTSKDMMMFSDFPPPEDFPPFLTHEAVLKYFRLYAENFDLLRHIRFRSEVKYITKAPCYETTGRWKVSYSTSKSGSFEIHEEIFDGVLICSGHHSVPFTPEIPGLGTFKGEALHSHSYKTPEPFKDKTVVIVGMGNSAADIACDLAKTASRVYLSSRRGAWIVPRTAFWGLPADMLANSRVVFTLPLRLLDWGVQKQANFRIDHETYNLRPHHGVLNCHPTINDELPIHLVNGRVVSVPNLQSVDPEGVRLEDGSFCKCDVIIFATGYDYRLDFVDPGVLQLENNHVTLYKHMFPLELPHPTLAVVGLIQAIGAVMPIAEMQSRWYARLMTGAVKLPPKENMLTDIEEKRSRMSKLYVESRRHTMQTFWIDYMDQVASQIGARPCLWRMLWSDPELAIKCYLGPCLPAQYRLTGPGTWDGARQFIVSALTRATKPRSTTPGKLESRSNSSGSANYRPSAENLDGHLDKSAEEPTAESLQQHEKDSELVLLSEQRLVKPTCNFVNRDRVPQSENNGEATQNCGAAPGNRKLHLSLERGIDQTSVVQTLDSSDESTCCFQKNQRPTPTDNHLELTKDPSCITDYQRLQEDRQEMILHRNPLQQHKRNGPGQNCGLQSRVESTHLSAKDDHEHVREPAPAARFWSPDWMTFAFYLVLLVSCALAWLLTQLLSEAQDWMAAVDRGRRA